METMEDTMRQMAHVGLTLGKVHKVSKVHRVSKVYKVYKAQTDLLLE